MVLRATIWMLVAVLLPGCASMSVDNRSEELLLMLEELDARQAVVTHREQVLQRRQQQLTELESTFTNSNSRPQPEVDAVGGELQAALPLPHGARADQCYGLAWLPPVFRPQPREVVVREPSEILHAVPAQYEYQPKRVLLAELPEDPAMLQYVVEEPLQVELRPAQRSINVKPAIMATETVQMPAREAHLRWQPCEELRGVPAAVALRYCAVEVPGTTQQIEREVVRRPATSQVLTEPAEVRELLVQRFRPPEGVAVGPVRQRWQELQVQRLVAPARIEQQQQTAAYRTITVQTRAVPGRVVWRDVFCRAEQTAAFYRSLREALVARGYTVAASDAPLDARTWQELSRFQQDQALAQSAPNISRETLAALMGNAASLVIPPKLAPSN